MFFVDELLLCISLSLARSDRLRTGKTITQSIGHPPVAVSVEWHTPSTCANDHRWEHHVIIPMANISFFAHRYSMECGANDPSLHPCWTSTHCHCWTSRSVALGNRTTATRSFFVRYSPVLLWKFVFFKDDACRGSSLLARRILWACFPSETLRWSTWSKASFDEKCHSTSEKVSLRSNCLSPTASDPRCPFTVQVTRELIKTQMDSIPQPAEKRESR